MLIRIRNLISLFGTLAWRSVSDISVYLRVSLLPGRVLVVYTLLAALLLALGHTAHFWFQTKPLYQTQANQIWDELITNWPDNFSLQYRENAWTMTPSDEAFNVPYPQDFTRPEGSPEYLATLLPVEPQTISAQIPSFFVAGPKSFLFQSPGQGQDNSSQIFLWTDFIEDGQEITLNKQSVQDQTSNFQTLLEFALEQLALTIFLWRFLGVWFLRLLSLFLYAWLAQVLWSLRERNLRYGSVYKMGLLLIPLAEAVMLFWKVFLPNQDAAFSFWWVWMILMGVIVFTAPRKQHE